MDNKTFLPRGEWKYIFGSKKMENVRLADYVRQQRKIYRRSWATDTHSFVKFAQDYVAANYH